jgi:hypothetical protein
MKRLLCLIAASAALSALPIQALARQAPAGGDAATSELEDMLDLTGGGRLKGARLEAAIAKASAYPLGSRENPVRVSMPQGQHAYLRRLRCSNDKAPTFERVGNFGPGVFGSIIDGYQVTCTGDGPPAETMIYMDMYHPDHDETAAPPGFTFKARARQP